VLSRLTNATPWTVLCVNTDRPLFWLIARDTYASAGELKGHRIAIHPPHTMPGWFCRIVLRRLGLDPDHDIQPVVMTPGDYGRHLRRLAEGTLDAAFVGSTLAPRSPPSSTACGCWPSSATTSRSPQSASPWTPPT
jgi:NitT/TauT family transport system substrate-binding protein